MRLRSSCLVLLLCLLTALAAPAADMGEGARGARIERADIDSATKTLETDPNLATSRTTRAPRWRSDADKSSSSDFGWLKSVIEIFRWLATISRVFVWTVLGLLLALLVVYLSRILRNADLSGAGEGDAPPTHVRDLDIRPESLPDDIGAAAWAMWEQGEQRAALALLYRGLVSRLVHVHQTPIRASSTDGDCLALARGRLEAEALAFVEQAIRVWERATYGAQAPQSQQVRVLCDAFAKQLQRTPSIEAMR